MAQRIEALRPVTCQALINRFGPAGYNPKTNTYRVPGRHKAAFDEMVRPHRRLEQARGLELAAEAEPKVRLRHKDGSLHECSPQNAAAVSRLVGAVEAPRYRGLRIVPLDAVDEHFTGFAEDGEGYLYRASNGELTPTGHRHLPFMEPQPWVKAYCRGCQEETLQAEGPTPAS